MANFVDWQCKRSRWHCCRHGKNERKCRKVNGKRLAKSVVWQERAIKQVATSAKAKKLVRNARNPLVVHVVRQFKFPQTETKLLTVITLKEEREKRGINDWRHHRVQMITLGCEIKRVLIIKNWYCTQNPRVLMPFCVCVSLSLCVSTGEDTLSHSFDIMRKK